MEKNFKIEIDINVSNANHFISLFELQEKELESQLKKTKNYLRRLREFTLKEDIKPENFSEQKHNANE